MKKSLLAILINMLCFFINVGSVSSLELPPLHHVVKVIPGTAIKVPSDWALNEKGEVDCVTCHSDENIDQIDFADVDKTTPDFFRGGPFDDLSQFCFRCHDAKAYERVNIHKQKDTAGEVIESTCTYCHVDVLNPKNYSLGDDLKLRMAMGESCAACHLKTPHLNAYNHLRKPSEKVRQHMSVSEKDFGVKLPLNTEGRITCVSCHSPHEYGVLSPNSPMGMQVNDSDVERGIIYEESPWNIIVIEDKKQRLGELSEQSHGKYTPHLGYKKIEAEVLLRLPARTGKLCQACHDFKDERRR